MSPWNSYFTETVILETIHDIVDQFWEAGILIPDIPAISTYIALWYPENRAKKDKALPKGNALKNKCIRAVHSLWIDTSIHIFDWRNEIQDNAMYLKAYSNILELYMNNPLFKKEANATTLAVLRNTNKLFKNIDSATEIWVHYLLSEFACLEFLSSSLKTNIVYVYHKPWKVYEDYIHGKFDGIKKWHLSFLQIQPKNS